MLIKCTNCSAEYSEYAGYCPYCKTKNLDQKNLIKTALISHIEINIFHI